MRALAKGRAALLLIGSAGHGNLTHLAGVFISDKLGFKVTHVPYKGSDPAILALMAGDIDLMYDVPPSSLQHARGGMLQPLAVSTPPRLEARPRRRHCASSASTLARPTPGSAWSRQWAPRRRW